MGRSNFAYKEHFVLRHVFGTTGTNWVSLPLSNAYPTLKSMCLDLESEAIAFGKLDPETGGATTFTCSIPVAGPSIDKGQAPFVHVKHDNDTWDVVGSDDPDFIFSLSSLGDGNWISVPYSAPYIMASDIYNDVQDCMGVGQFVAATDAQPNYDGNPSNDFVLDLTMAVVITVTSDVTWKPKSL